VVKLSKMDGTHVSSDWGSISIFGSIHSPIVPCDHFPDVTFSFAGKPFTIPGRELNLGPVMEGSSDCFSGIYGPSKTLRKIFHSSTTSNVITPLVIWISTWGLDYRVQFPRALLYCVQHGF
jgi:hypothetical protein